ncbi:MAG: single-stranded-DNA-specific exonuclease RecJ [Halothece sp. Uz-M2-17]|nr:single-stranded-DNA-specific exonuclease RecJ [Halothece sp. Uz-M2-17]
MSHWQILSQPDVPDWFLTEVEAYCSHYPQYVAQLLWQRGIDNLERLQQFLDVESYRPTSGFTGFGQQMDLAVKRCQEAWENQEKVAIWGDFDADGVTATSVLWEGLQPFFSTSDSLSYYIPNRLTESHGLNETGLRKLAAEGVKLVITCDTGSTNLAEMEVAQNLGIDIIVTDHHTLPEDNPNVVAILNPKYLVASHPLYHLSGVAVAYKFIEALYETFPDIPEQPAEILLDLVAIGLIADLVELQGDCRYLAQKGIQKLAQQLNHPTRPGIAQLLRLCKRNGDRPMDIAFGIGPRINAISRIQGDATFAVELLTSKEETVCKKLAQKTEIANTRRKELQRDVERAVKQRIETLDLSTTGVIVLADSQWQAGVLGLVAGQIAQEYARPTILLNLDQSSEENLTLARGSARSVEKIDLYQLLRSQQHLLHRFGGHPFAAGLSIKAENLSIFTEAINQQFRQQYGNTTPEPSLSIDLTLTVAELGQDLFQSLKLLEPYGMGNPLPRLLIQNCWFKNVGNKNIKDYTGKMIRYIRTTFKVCDETKPEGFPGMWWGHYKDELPENQYFDTVVELDFNAYQKEYEVRIVEVKAVQQQDSYSVIENETPLLLDYRGKKTSVAETQDSVLILDHCPRTWEEMNQGLQEGMKNNCAIALTYSLPNPLPAEEIWKQFLGIAKYLSRTRQTVSCEQLQNKLRLSPRTIELGLNTLNHLGFEIEGGDTIQITGSAKIDLLNTEAVQSFLAAIQEEQFRCQYFTEVPLEMIREEGLSH